MFRVGYLRVRGASRDLRACRPASRASRPCVRHTLREVIAFAAERLMEIEVGALAGRPMARRARLAWRRYVRTAALRAHSSRFRTDLPSNLLMAGVKRLDSSPSHRNVGTEQRAGLMREESDEGTCA